MGKRRLNIIGCGKVAKTLARLWSSAGTFEICDVLNRSSGSAVNAVKFLEHGRAIQSLAEMRGADVYLIGTADSEIPFIAKSLSETMLLKSGDIVFHLSGALSSCELSAAKSCGASTASVHPLKSFADIGASVLSFSGTFCAVEGDPQACKLLSEAIAQIGGDPQAISSDQKTIYHASAVIVCNYLVSVLELGLRGFEKSGMERSSALKAIEPLVKETVVNVFKYGTVDALTGPIARGDHAVVERQLVEFGNWDPLYGRIYRDLGLIALELSAAKGGKSQEELSALSEILASN